MFSSRYVCVTDSRSVLIAVAAALAIQTVPASAQDAARDVPQAIANCISNYMSPQNVEPAFRQTGFTLGDDGMSTFAEKGEVFVYYNADEKQERNSCSIFTGAVSLRDAHTMAMSVANQLFPNSVHDGPPERGPDDCLAVSVFAPRNLMVMRIYDNGNGGTCTGQDGSSIAISF